MRNLSQHKASAGDAIRKRRHTPRLSPKTRYATHATTITPPIHVAPPGDTILRRRRKSQLAACSRVPQATICRSD